MSYSDPGDWFAFGQRLNEQRSRYFPYELGDLPDPGERRPRNYPFAPVQLERGEIPMSYVLCIVSWLLIIASFAITAMAVRRARRWKP